MPTESAFCFQAEDGIRAHCVTGVQTCALPIFGDHALVADGVAVDVVGVLELAGLEVAGGAAGEGVGEVDGLGGAELGHALACEIGRASCRERVYKSPDAGGWRQIID